MNTNQTQVNYNLIKQQIGTVVIDSNFKQYVVADYKIGCDAYYLWDKEDQQFYYTDYNAFNRLYTQISGWFLILWPQLVSIKENRILGSMPIMKTQNTMIISQQKIMNVVNTIATTGINKSMINKGTENVTFQCNI